MSTDNDYNTSPRTDGEKPTNVSVVGVVIGLICTAFPVSMTICGFCSAGRGAAVRPMFLLPAIFFWAAAGMLVGVPISIAGIFLDRGRKKWLGVFGVVLNLAIFPACMAAMETVIWAMGQTLDT